MATAILIAAHSKVHVRLETIYGHIKAHFFHFYEISGLNPGSPGFTNISGINPGL